MRERGRWRKRWRDSEYTTLMKFQLACHVEGSDCSHATFICEWQPAGDERMTQEREGGEPFRSYEILTHFILTSVIMHTTQLPCLILSNNCKANAKLCVLSSTHTLAHRHTHTRIHSRRPRATAVTLHFCHPVVHATSPERETKTQPDKGRD